MKTMITLGVLGLSLKGAMAHDGLGKYEKYLNEIKTLSGKFTQVTSRGSKTTGYIQISRPGKMRLTYSPPSTLLMIANGKWLLTYDQATKDADYVSVENTPAAFILRPHVQFKGDVAVTNVVPKGTTTEISLVRSEDPDAGYITLVFNENPISLKEWSIIDAQGVQTRVVLSDLKPNVSLPSELFRIKNPNLLQQIF